MSPLTKLLQSQHLWKSNKDSHYYYTSPIYSCSKINFLGLHKRSICVNSCAALYWGADGRSNNEQVLNQLARERELLDEITVTQTVQHGADYQMYGPQLNNNNNTHATHTIDPNHPYLRMTSSARDKAIKALDMHGVCIIKNLFPSEIVKKWGDAALQDLELASNQLKMTKGIDLDNPIEGQVINIHIFFNKINNFIIIVGY